jgi:hypothetical protein
MILFTNIHYKEIDIILTRHLGTMVKNDVDIANM